MAGNAEITRRRPRTDGETKDRMLEIIRNTKWELGERKTILAGMVGINNQRATKLIDELIEDKKIIKTEQGKYVLVK